MKNAMTPSADAVRALLSGLLPGEPCADVRRLGGGLDHTAFLVDERLVVRFAHDGGAAAGEARLLAALGPLLPVPVPAPVAAEAGWLVYERLPGVPLLALPREQRATVLPALRDCLATLHGATGLAALLPRDETPPAEWRDEARASFPDVAPLVPSEHLAAVEAFLDAPAPEPAERLVPVHNDLGAEHVLVGGDPPAVTGVIDWSDAAVGDPAVDLGRLLRDLGPDVLPDAGARAWFYARCATLEDLAFGRDEYVANARAAIPALFG